MQQKRNQLIGFAVIGIFVVFIWGNSFVPRSLSGETSDSVKAFLISLFGEGTPVSLFLESYVRKIGHFVEYSALGCAVTCTALAGGARWNLQRLWNGFSFALFVAAADESIQIFTGRGPMMQDVLLDMCGVLILGAVTTGVIALCRLPGGRRNRPSTPKPWR